LNQSSASFKILIGVLGKHFKDFRHFFTHFREPFNDVGGGPNKVRGLRRYLGLFLSRERPVGAPFREARGVCHLVLRALPRSASETTARKAKAALPKYLNRLKMPEAALRVRLKSASEKPELRQSLSGSFKFCLGAFMGFPDARLPGA
jgi:hypothetical protein